MTYTTFKEIKEASNMTVKAMSKTLNIPVPTLEAWCRGIRIPPDYVLELIVHRLNSLGYLKEDG